MKFTIISDIKPLWCGIDVKTFGLFIGILLLVVRSLISVCMVIILKANYIEILQQEIHSDFFIFIGILLAFLIATITSILFIFGIRKNNQKYIIPHLILETILICAYSVGVVTIFVFAICTAVKNGINGLHGIIVVISILFYGK